MTAGVLVLLRPSVIKLIFCVMVFQINLHLQLYTRYQSKLFWCHVITEQHAIGCELLLTSGRCGNISRCSWRLDDQMHRSVTLWLPPISLYHVVAAGSPRGT